MAPVTAVEIGSIRIPISDANLQKNLGAMDENGDGIFNGDDTHLQSGSGGEAARYVSEQFALAVEQTGEVAPSVDFLLNLEKTQTALNHARDVLSKIESLRSGSGFCFKAFSKSYKFSADKWLGAVLPLFGDQQDYSAIVAGALAIYKGFVSQYIKAQLVLDCLWMSPVSTNPIHDRRENARIVAIDGVPPVMLPAVQNLVLTAGVVNSMKFETFPPSTKRNYRALECVGKGCPDNDVIDGFESPLPEIHQCYSLNQWDVTCFDRQLQLDVVIQAWKSYGGSCRLAAE